MRKRVGKWQFTHIEKEHVRWWFIIPPNWCPRTTSSNDAFIHHHHHDAREREKFFVPAFEQQNIIKRERMEKKETFWTAHKYMLHISLKDTQPNNYLFPSQTINLFILKIRRPTVLLSTSTGLKLSWKKK